MEWNHAQRQAKQQSDMMRRAKLRSHFEEVLAWHQIDGRLPLRHESGHFFSRLASLDSSLLLLRRHVEGEDLGEVVRARSIRREKERKTLPRGGSTLRGHPDVRGRALRRTVER